MVMALFFGACDLFKKNKDNDPGPEPDRVLVSYEKLTDTPITTALLDLILNSQAVFNNKIIQNALKFPVDVYKIIYKTTFQGAEKQVSGACVIPSAAEALPVVSYQHGTIFHNKDAPSQFKNILNMPIEMALNILMASCGFVCAAPDYIGYGSDGSSVHPYHHADSLATSCIDMLRAVKEMCAELNVTIKNQYFMTGYSEGGYATLSVQKKIEANFASEFPLMAVSAGAGAYDLLGTVQDFVGSATLKEPAYVCFLIWAYRSIYAWDRALQSFFREPYNSSIKEGLFTGSHTYGQVDSQLTNVTADLFTAAFLSDFKGSGEQTLKDALQENNLHKGWTPSTPLRLYHGTADETVPAFNSERAENNFINRGAPDVQYISFPGLNHSTCIIPWVIGTIQWFTSL